MMVDPSTMPTHIACVVRRLNTCDPEDLGTYFLETSYLVSCRDHIENYCHKSLCRTQKLSTRYSL